MKDRKGKVNIIKKKEKDVRLGSIIDWYGDTYIVIWDRAFNSLIYLITISISLLISFTLSSLIKLSRLVVRSKLSSPVSIFNNLYA